jgi:hypothetical protein
LGAAFLKERTGKHLSGQKAQKTVGVVDKGLFAPAGTDLGTGLQIAGAGIIAGPALDAFRQQIVKIGRIKKAAFFKEVKFAAGRV